MRRRTLLRLCGAFAIAPAMSCTTSKKAYHRATEDLKDAVRAYNEALKNGDVEKALAFIPAPDRPAFLDELSKLSKNVRWTDVKVGAVELPEKGTEATVTVTRSYYLLNELTEKQESLNQTWLRKAKEGRWQMKWAGKP